ncbi:MAG: TolC family protein, partial [Myxococcales bacterium]
QKNERARAAPLQVEIAEGQRERARAGFLPSVVVGANTTGRPEANQATGSRLSTAATLTLTQPLLNPSAFPLYDQAKHNVASARYGSLEDQRVLAFDTARAHLQALATERVRDAAVDRLARARANLDNAQARAEAQLNSINDATRARVDLATAMRDAASTTASLRRAQLQLSLLVGQPVEGTLEAPDALGRAAQDFKGDPAGMAGPAVDRRPDVLGLRQDIEAARASAREPLYRLIPTLGLAAQLRGDPNTPPGAKTFDETLSLTLSWTIFDGGARYGDLRTRRAQAETLALNEQLLRRSVDTAIRTSLAALDAAREALTAAEAGAAAAKANSEETQILYQQGLARALELTDANGRRFDADVALASARLSLTQSFLELRFALGLWPLEDRPPAEVRGDRGSEARRAGPSPMTTTTAATRVDPGVTTARAARPAEVTP